MSERQYLAEHATGLCVAGLAAAGLGAVAAPLVPLAVLTAWGIDRYKSCRERKTRNTVDRVIKEFERSNPNHRAVGPALALLKENRDKISISPQTLADAKDRGDFPNTLYNVVFKNSTVPTDDGVEALLRMILTAAWQDLRQEDEFHKVFVQESVTTLERDMKNGFQRIESLLKGVKQDTSDLLAGQSRFEQKLDQQTALIERLVAEKEDTARAFHIKEGMLIGLARNYAATAHDFDSALAGLQLALETAKREQERDALPSNLGEAVDRIVAQVAELNAAERLDEADALLAAEMKRLDAEIEEKKAAQIRIVDKAIAQAVYTADAAAYARRSQKRIQLEAPSPTDQFHRLYGEFAKMFEDGQRSAAQFPLRAALALIETCREIAPSPELQGWADNSLGNALSTLGERSGDTVPLTRAVEAFEAALTVRTQEASEMDWAMTQNNLGTALQALGQRSGDTAPLTRAVKAFEAALTVRTREASEMAWAATQNNLGNALSTLGERSGDTVPLTRAVEAYEAALTVRTPEASEMAWAATQNNLGIALSVLGQRSGDTGTLTRAVKAFEAALTVYAREASEMAWAMTQNNLGTALSAMGERSGDTAPLTRAVEAFEAALTVRTREASEMDWAATQNNLGNALRAMGARSGDTAPLTRAVEAYETALTVYTREASEIDWAMTQNNLGNALRAMGERSGDTGTLTRAVKAYEAALTVYTREASEMDWAGTKGNLAQTHLVRTGLLSGAEKAGALGAGLDAVDAALEVFTPEGAGHYHQWAMALREKITGAG